MSRVFVQRNFEFDPSDVAVAFYNVVTAKYGQAAFKGVRDYLLRQEPMRFVNVKIGHSEEAKVIVDRFCIKGFFIVKANFIGASIPESTRKEVEQLLDQVGSYLRSNSVYKGKAIRILFAGDPRNEAIVPYADFLDTSRICLDQLVYNQDVLRDLRTHVWNLIERPRECVSMGLKLQRKIVFRGTFGSGKTSAAMLTADIARRNGWTFCYLEPTIRQAGHAISYLLEFGRKYQRSCLLIEDLDREQRGDDPFILGSVMNAVDGVMSKASEMIVIMTTNFGEKLAGGLQRPGRIDKIIDFNKFEPEDAKRLLRTMIKEENLSDDISWDLVLREATSYPPAFVGGVGEAAKLMAVDKAGKGVKPVVTQEMLISACRDLRTQYKACMENSLGFGKSSEA